MRDPSMSRARMMALQNTASINTSLSKRLDVVPLERSIWRWTNLETNMWENLSAAACALLMML